MLHRDSHSSPESTYREKRSRDKLEKSRSENSMLQSRLEEYTRMTAKLRSDVESGQKDLRDELLEAQQTTRDAENVVADLQAEIAKLESKLTSKTEKHKMLKEAIQLAEAKAENAVRELSGMEAHHKAELENSARLNEQGIKVEVETVRQELEMEKRLRASASAAHEEALDKAKEAWDSERGALLREFNTAKSKLAGLEADNQVLQGSSRDYQARAEMAEARVNELEALSGRLEVAHTEGAAKIKTLEIEVERLVNETIAHIESLNQTQERLAMAYSDLEKEKIRREERESKLEGVPKLEGEVEALRKDLEACKRDAEANIEAVRVQEAEERAKAMQKLMHSQVHVVVSAPCIKLVINHSKDQVYLSPPEEVTRKVKKLLEEDVLPEYLAVMASAPERASQLAGDKMTKFCDDVAAGINDQIQQIVLGEGAAAGVIQRG